MGGRYRINDMGFDDAEYGLLMLSHRGIDQGEIKDIFYPGVIIHFNAHNGLVSLAIQKDSENINYSYSPDILKRITYPISMGVACVARMKFIMALDTLGNTDISRILSENHKNAKDEWIKLSVKDVSRTIQKIKNHLRPVFSLFGQNRSASSPLELAFAQVLPYINIALLSSTAEVERAIERIKSAALENSSKPATPAM